MKVFLHINHFKTLRVVHLGVNFSGCINELHIGFSISLLLITIGVHIYKSHKN